MTNIPGYAAYTMYVAVKTHFKNEKYNYFRHRGAKITEGSLKKHKDRYWFIKLQEKYGEDDLLDFFLAQFTTNHLHEYWVGDSFGERAQELYTIRKRRMSSFTRSVGLEFQYLYETFDKDLLYKVDSGYPKIITAYLGGRLCLETLIVLDDINHWSDGNDALTGIVGAPLALSMSKYRPFLNYNIAPLRKKYNDLISV